MKAISIHGPWAYYERTMADSEAQIKQLREEVARHQSDAADARQALREEQARSAEYIECTVPSLHNVIDDATQRVQQLEQQLHQAREQNRECQLAASASHEAAMGRMQQLLADNMVLKAELAKTVHVNHVTSTKVDQVRKHLGLGKEEAEAFVKDLDSTKAANKALQSEVAGLASDKAHLQQQCDNRSSHALTLIAENKRLLEQVGELRRQVVAMDQDLWRTKQDLAAAHKVGAKVAQRREAAAIRDQARPEWQGLREAPSSAAKASSRANSARHTASHSPTQLQHLYTQVGSTARPRATSASASAKAAQQGPSRGASKAAAGTENSPPPAYTAEIKLAAAKAAEEQMRKLALSEVLAARQRQQQAERQSELGGLS